jgi:hypothetical protein
VPFSLLVVSSFVFFQLVLAPQKPMRLAAGVNIDPNNIGTSIDPARAYELTHGEQIRDLNL